MATNGVYFGAEIVRDLTLRPRQPDGKEETEGERGWGGGGVGEGSLHHLWLPPSCFLSPTPLCPSLSICLSASFLLWLSISPPPHPLVCLFFSGQGSRTPCFGTQAAP